MQKRIGALAAAVLLLGGLAVGQEKQVRVVATLPHLAAHARAVGGERASVVALGTPLQDPHFIQPTPALMVEANKADIYVEVGYDLELWSEHVLDGARNQDIRIGGPGHVFAATGVPVIERPATVSRAQGDVHPNGNPHIWVDPLNAVVEAQNIADALKREDPAGAAEYEKRFEDYKARIVKAYFGEELVRLLGEPTLTGLARKAQLFDFLGKKKYKGEPLAEKVGGWLGKMWPHRGKKVLTYHREWSYFCRAFDLELVNTLEPKPGIPPTPGHLSMLEATARDTRIGAILSAPFYNIPLARSFSERTGIPLVVAPQEPSETGDGPKDYIALMDQVVNDTAAALAKSDAGGSK